jgi:hypothetical protein
MDEACRTDRENYAPRLVDPSTQNRDEAFGKMHTACCPPATIVREGKASLYREMLSDTFPQRAAPP